MPAAGLGRPAALRAAVAAVPLDRTAGDDPCALLLVELGEALDALSAARRPGAREPACTSTAHLHGRRCGRLGNLPNWGGDRAALDRARETANDVSAALGEMLRRARGDALAGLLPPVARLMLDEAAARRREGALVFDDLILWARDLLRDSPPARAALRARYDALLIDEFQDTDPLAGVDRGVLRRATPPTGAARAGPPLPGGRPEAVDLPLPPRRHGGLRRRGGGGARARAA